MSLRHAAQYLAAHGRGADTTLMHVAPDEVARLQRAAQERGGSLSINPHTGLPEANFFSDLNPVSILQGEGNIGKSGLGPTLAALAVNYFAPGAGEALGLSQAAATGAIVGGASALATGSLKKGLMAGIGAYGATGLGEAAMGGVDSASREQAVLNSFKNELPLPENIPVARQMSIADTIKGGAKGIASLGPRDLFKFGSAAAGPILSSLANEQNKKLNNLPSSSTPGGYIRQYYFDPKSQSVKPLAPVRTQDFGDTTFESRVPYIPKSAGGGLQSSYAMGGVTDDGMADGGMADGGTLPKTVEDLYTGILGRPSDAGGAAYWQQRFGDTLDPNEINTFTQSANVELANRTAAQTLPPAPPAAAPISAGIENLYTSILGRPSDAGGLDYWSKQFGDTVDATERNTFIQAAKPEQQVADMYRNVLGRDPDPGGLQYWTTRINQGEPASNVYNEFLGAARENTELVNADNTINKDFATATTPYTGYRSKDQTNIVDEWVRNTLGREPTAADREQMWYKDAFNAMKTAPEAKNLYGNFQTYAKAEKNKDVTASLAARGVTEADVLRQTGKTIAELVASDIDPTNLIGASQLRAPGAKTGFDFSGIRKPTTPQTNAPAGTTNPYGNAINPGDITRNVDGSTTVTPNIPGRPYGGFTGMGQVRDAYTVGGGKLGQILTPSKTYQNTGASADIYKYLMGKGDYPIQETGIGKNFRYYHGVEPTTSNPTNKYRINPQTHMIELNPNYVAPAANGGLMQAYAYAGGGTTSQDENKKGTGNPNAAAMTAAAFDAMTPAQKADHQAQLAAINEGLTPMVVKILQQIKNQILFKDKNEPLAPVENMDTLSPDAIAQQDAAIALALADNAENAPTVSDNPAALMGDTSGDGGVSSGGVSATSGSPMGGIASIGTVGQANAAVAAANAAAANGVGGIGVGGGNAGTGNGGTSSGVGTGIGGLGGIGGGLAYGGLTAAMASGGYINNDNFTRYMATGGISVGSRPDPNIDGQYQPPPNVSFQPTVGRFAAGGEAGYNLGGYSDGGRLLRGPGDGVSDSIPATIGHKQPARLADGEFVVPARIVSELGNGSTEAGARKLYAMMERVQQARGKTVGKGKVAKNSRADKYLPK